MASYPLSQALLILPLPDVIENVNILCEARLEAFLKDRKCIADEVYDAEHAPCDKCRTERIVVRPEADGTRKVYPCPACRRGEYVAKLAQMAREAETALVLSTWERVAMQQIVDLGPMPASSGSSAVFDAAWELERRGLLEADYSRGQPYLTMTPQGWRAWIARER